MKKRVIAFLLLASLILPCLPFAVFAAGVGDVVPGTLGEVRLITGSELEIEFSSPVLNNADAQATFKIIIDGTEAEWEYLSYFAFGDYAAKPVVNARLKTALDAGEPRGRRRTSTAEAYLARTEDVKGPIAAAKVTVKAASAEKIAAWEPFYMERSQGNMSRNWTYASQKAGNNGTVLKLSDTLTNMQDARNVFSATSEPLYTDEFVVRMVAEGMNKMTGRSEYLNLPMIYDGFRALIVGSSQSVYEVPEYRELYKHGITADTFTRKNIKASDVPGNLNAETNEFVKPFIVGTADDVFKHYSALKADGSPATGNADSARPAVDHFYFGEAFFDLFYHLGVQRGSQGYPLTTFNQPDDYRFDIHLQEAYDKAKAAGMWPNTKMMLPGGTVKDYYVYGAMAHFEMLEETQAFAAMSGPINTRAEVDDYDYPLYWALSGLHSQWQFWCGTGTGQAVSSTNDSGKPANPWFWQSKQDNYGLPATPNSTAGVAYPPLAIESVTVVDHNDIHVVFNREVRTTQAVTAAANWKIYIDDREVTPTVFGGYTWKSIRLRTNHAVSRQTGLSTANPENRLDNGKPYGYFFSGFTQKDIDERKVDAGGWIDNDQQPGKFALEYGEFVSVNDSIEKYGAGLGGKIEVAYIGGASAAPEIKDWSGNELPKTKVAATFMPWVGHIYRTPLTGFYVYLDSYVGEGGYFDSEKNEWVKGFYMYRNEPEGFLQPTAKEIAMAAGHQYEVLFANNRTVTYPKNAGGDDFDFAFNGNKSEDWSLTGNTGATPNWGLDYTWDNGVVKRTDNYGPGGIGGAGYQESKQGPITYDRPGQMGIDGFAARSGGCVLGAGSVRGRHSLKQPHSSGLGGNIGDSLRIEGTDSILFQSIDIAVLRDYNLVLYRNENLILHEGGHGIDFALQTYGIDVFNDITAAFATGTAPKNGMRWFTVDGVRSYQASRSEYVSMATTYFTGTSRESFEGINDGVWTPVANREEFNRYDPYGFEVLKRLMFNGDLGLWYENKIGNPAYRVIPEDWKLLKDLGQTDPDYAFAKNWTGENDLIAWGLSISAVAHDNPYTGQHNSLVRWVSYSAPSIWDVEPYLVPTRTDWRANIKYDFTGRVPYNAPAEEGKPPTKVQTHPFFTDSGVKMPVRPAETAALVAPVSGKIVEGSLKMISQVLLEFELEDFSGEVTMNNAPASFDLRVDGQLEHFYFWTFEDLGNGVAKVQLRLEWPEENDPILRLIVKATGQSALSDAVLKMNLSKGVVEKGEYFTLSPSFSRAVASNVAVLNYTFNKNLFDYRAFEPAPGVTVISAEPTNDGYKVIVMIPDYAMKDYGVFTFSAKEDVDLKLEAQKIALAINFVEKIGENKYTKLAMVDTILATSDGTDPTNPPDGEFTLITLSNAIDFFGLRKGQPGWEIALFFDYNANSEIDISDITHIASKIIL